MPWALSVRAKIRVFLDGDDEAREEVEMPIPEVPDDLLPPNESWGGWRWVGQLPKARIDLSKNYCLAIYVVRTRSTQARKLGDAVRRGVNRVPGRPAGKPGPPPIPEEKVRQIVRLGRRGMSSRQIGSQVGVSFMTVGRVLRRERVQPRSPWGGARRPVDPGRLEAVVEMIAEGARTPAIVRKTGVSQSKVNALRREREAALRADTGPTVRKHRPRAPSPLRFKRVEPDSPPETPPAPPEEPTPEFVNPLYSESCKLCDRTGLSPRGLVGHMRVVHGVLKSGERAAPGRPAEGPAARGPEPTAPGPRRGETGVVDAWERHILRAFEESSRTIEPERARRIAEVTAQVFGDARVAAVDNRDLRPDQREQLYQLDGVLMDHNIEGKGRWQRHWWVVKSRPRGGVP
jgi:transposase